MLFSVFVESELGDQECIQTISVNLQYLFFSWVLGIQVFVLYHTHIYSIHIHIMYTHIIHIQYMHIMYMNIPIFTILIHSYVYTVHVM